ncbi:MAG: universal stress protein [Bacteroidota bacterium]
MKKIIVPVDFSDTSLAAYFFAVELAKKFEASIDVVHIYDGSINTNQGLTFELMQTKEGSILNQLQQFINIAPDEGGTQVAVNVNCKTYLAYNTSARICKLSADYDLIIMGMTGKHALEKKLLGSIASYVGQHAECPVLIVPRNYQYKGLHNIVYARNWESMNEVALRSVVELAKVFQSAIHFVHVNEELSIMDFAITEQATLAELLAEDAPAVAYQIVNVDSSSPKQGIEDYAQDKEADLIVLVNRQHSFIDNLFKRSMTKEMALHSKVPLLIYHARKSY